MQPNGGKNLIMLRLKFQWNVSGFVEEIADFRVNSLVMSSQEFNEGQLED